MTNKTVSLVLGSGGARGLAHIGVIHWLEADCISAKIRNYINDLKTRTPTNSAGSWKMLGIADQTFDAMQGAIARQKLAAYPPDHTIMIARNACGTLEFDRADEMITLGYESASRCLDKS